MKRRTTTKRRSSQKRAKNRVRLFLVLSVLNVALIIGTILLLPSAFKTVDKTTGKVEEWLPVESISVEGNTRYDEEAIIGVSGIKTGQSVFSVNKSSAANKIRKQPNFSYIEKVSIDISLKRHVTITVTEAEELGAVYVPIAENKDGTEVLSGRWMVVSREGIGLMYLPVESERPFRRLYLKGARIKSGKLGEQVLEDRDLAIALELTRAMDANGLTGVGEIDLTSRSDIRLNWKNQIKIALGNDSNLTYEIAAAVSAIPKILSRHGDTATGLLNLSQYSDSTISSPVIVFTPSSILNAEKEKTEVPEGTNPSGTDAGGSTTTTGTTRAR